jgi:Holliday junction resolvasome RuvABC endonuclease subunit
MAQDAIGFRVTPEATFYAVVRRVDDRYEVVAKEIIKHPKAHNEPQKLAHLRQTVRDLLETYQVRLAGVKLIENNSQNSSSFRLNCEGVIQEALASSKLDGFFFGAIPAISGAIRIKDKKLVKQLIQGSKMPEFCKWEEKQKSEYREAILAAIAALHDGN